MIQYSGIEQEVKDYKQGGKDKEDMATQKFSEQLVNKTSLKMMGELGYDAELTYKKKAAE